MPDQVASRQKDTNMMRQAFQLEAMRRSSRQSVFPPWRMN